MLMKTNYIETRENQIYGEYTCGGYNIERWVRKANNGETYTRICIYNKDAIEYQPDIYYHDETCGKKEPRFEIQTHGYGTKSPEEIKKVIAGYEYALDAVEEMTHWFIDRADECNKFEAADAGDYMGDIVIRNSKKEA